MVAEVRSGLAKEFEAPWFPSHVHLCDWPQKSTNLTPAILVVYKISTRSRKVFVLVADTRENLGLERLKLCYTHALPDAQEQSLEVIPLLSRSYHGNIPGDFDSFCLEKQTGDKTL